MKNQNQIDSSKTVPITTLFVTAALITIVGAVFSVISVVNDISFVVMNNQVPGVVFGLVIVFLGVRYLFSVQKLKAEVYKSTSQFAWSNFKSKAKK